MTVLREHPWRRAPAGPVIALVMDGIGIGRGDPGDAVASAHTPTLDWLRRSVSSRLLRAHGSAVGMPSETDMGNSEVGHNAIGAGRVFEQGASLVRDAVHSGSLFAGPVWKDAIAQVRASGEPIHFVGLLSDGNVHSHIDHLLAMIQQVEQAGIHRLRVHVLLDGRDVGARSARGYAAKLEQVLAASRSRGFDFQVASGGGRMRITMDRYESDWSMVERGWNLHVHGQGRKFQTLMQAIETLYAESDDGDQFLDGFVICDDDGAVGPIRDGASVLLFNFRGDRALQLTRAFEESEFRGFERGRRPNVFFAGMMQYDGDLGLPRHFLVAPPLIRDTMGELLAAAGRRQLALAETHKFGHVTYFWNGNRSEKFDAALETYVEIRSPHTELQHTPWMCAAEVTDRLVHAVTRESYDFIRVNYANGDMVGHTGDFCATRLAVEVVDLCLARVVAAVKARGGVLVVTADHGNADEMIDAHGHVRTSHSLNPVPLCIFDPREPSQGPLLRELPDAGLANLAATMLELLGFEAPAHYAPSLLANQ